MLGLRPLPNRDSLSVAKRSTDSPQLSITSPRQTHGGGKQEPLRTGPSLLSQAQLCRGHRQSASPPAPATALRKQDP